MGRQWIMFPPHFVNGRIHFAHGVAERREGICRQLGRIRSCEHNLGRRVNPPAVGHPNRLAEVYRFQTTTAAQFP